MSKKTPSDCICEQHALIAQAIEYLQSQFDEMTDRINPDTESWKDVSEYAHIADMARGIISRANEL